MLPDAAFPFPCAAAAAAAAAVLGVVVDKLVSVLGAGSSCLVMARISVRGVGALGSSSPMVQFSSKATLLLVCWFGFVDFVRLFPFL